MRCEHSRTLWRRQPAGASRSSAVGYVWRSVDDHPLKLSSAFDVFFFCRKLLQGTLMLQLLNCIHLLAYSIETTSSRLISLAHFRRTGEPVLIRRRWVHGPRSLDSASKRRTASHLRSYHRKPFSLSIHWILCVVTGEKTRRPSQSLVVFHPAMGAVEYREHTPDASGYHRTPIKNALVSIICSSLWYFCHVEWVLKILILNVLCELRYQLTCQLERTSSTLSISLWFYLCWRLRFVFLQHHSITLS